MLIAITGGSGAGKSTLARAIATLNGARVIAEDDYYRCASAIPGFDADTYNFDAPEAKNHDLLIEHLRRFRNGECFDKPVYDLTTHRLRSETERVSPGGPLVVDGIHVLATAELRVLFDVRVFVAAEEELRLERRLARDIAERGRRRDAVVRQFRVHVSPMHERHVEPQRAYADIVVELGRAGADGAVEYAARQVLAYAEQAQEHA